MRSIRELVKILSIPLFFAAVYLSFLVIWKIFNLPQGGELLPIIRRYFESFGLIVIFVSALIEGFLILGQYFPGGFIIFLGVISAGNNIPLVIGVVLVVSIAFFISYTLNYLVGKYGWYRLFLKFGLKNSLEKAKKNLDKQGLNAVLTSYWEPNLASIIATAAGILQFPLKKFSLYSALGILIWNAFWGAFVFVLGDAALKLAGTKYILIIFFVWVSIILIKEFIVRRRIANQSQC